MYINKYFAIAVVSFTLTVGMVIGCTLQSQADTEQIETIMSKAAHSESHLLSTDGLTIYYIIPYNNTLNLSNNISKDKRR